MALAFPPPCSDDMNVPLSPWSSELLAGLDILALGEAHPRVFFSSQELDRLRARAARGGSAWGAVHADACELVEAPLRLFSRENEPDGGVLTLAFAFAIWEEPRFLAAALAAVQPLLQAPSWVARFHQPLQMDLRSSVVTSSLALACDLLGPSLPERLRLDILEALRSRDIGLFPGIRQTSSAWWTWRRMNWQAVINSHLGLAMLAIGDWGLDWRPQLRLAMEGVLDFLDHCHPDGSFPEGLSYWHYGVGELAWFALALKTVSQGALNLFHHPFMRATLDFPLHMITPDGCFDFEDCASFRPDDWLMALLAREYRNPVAQGLVVPFTSQPRPHRKLDAPARGMRHVLCYDESLAPAPADEQPCSRYFPDSGTVTLRSDWGPAATYLALQGGRNDVPHGHLDAGSFIIGCAGRRLIPDAGFWPYTDGFFDRRESRWDFDGAATVGHNLLLVDDQGQKCDPDAGATIEDVRLGGAMEWVVCNVTAAYPGMLQRFVRYLLFIRPRTVLVVDDIVADRPRHLKWVLQYSGRALLNRTSVLIEQDHARANVDFPLLPGDAPYRFTKEDRFSQYRANADDGQPRRVRLVSLAPLAATASWRVVAAIQLSEHVPESAPVSQLKHDGRRLRFRLATPQGECVSAAIDFHTRTVSNQPCRG
jgi:hypothetical protein